MYAEGAFDEFMKTGNPELVTKEQYESWVKASLRPGKYAEVVAANGEFPGQYMTTPDGQPGHRTIAVWQCGTDAADGSR